MLIQKCSLVRKCAVERIISLILQPTIDLMLLMCRLLRQIHTQFVIFLVVDAEHSVLLKVAGEVAMESVMIHPTSAMVRGSEFGRRRDRILRTAPRYQTI